MVKSKNCGVMWVDELLNCLDCFIGVILIGNNFVNILVLFIVIIIVIWFWGDGGIVIVIGLFMLVILVFVEVILKILVVLKLECIVFFVSLILKLFLVLFYFFVWLVNVISNGFLCVVGINIGFVGIDFFSCEEL